MGRGSSVLQSKIFLIEKIGHSPLLSGVLWVLSVVADRKYPKVKYKSSAEYNRRALFSLFYGTKAICKFRDL